MNFRSDNCAGAAPEILAAIEQANRGAADAYGADALTARLAERVTDLFEHETSVFPVATGTAANVLALAAITPRWGAIYCHASAHINSSECGAPEFYTGAKLIALPGENGKFTPSSLAAAIKGKGSVHRVQPAAVSISETTESGAVYTPDEIAAIAAVAKDHDLRLHMDGARFANALAFLGCSPAELSWRAGVDVLSLGATKNGALGAEIIIAFDTRLAEEIEFRRKQGGHLLSKMRFVSAQLLAYLTDDLWLRNARRANAMALRMAEGLSGLPNVRLRSPVEANELFLDMDRKTQDVVAKAGFQFHVWGEQGANLIRLVTSFETRLEDVDGFIAAVGAAG